MNRIHIFGASGSGTTTLGGALSAELDIPHLDTDRYYWKPTDPPFREKNAASDRIAMIEQDIADVESWILSGSVCSWGDPLLAYFTIAVFLHLAPSTRMARLKTRARERHGARTEPGGDMHTKHMEFMAWAESYDTACAPTRSLDLHEQWMPRLSCTVIRLDSGRPVHALVQEIVDAVA